MFEAATGRARRPCPHLPVARQESEIHLATTLVAAPPALSAVEGGLVGGQVAPRRTVPCAL
jgi:hypothetical protein